MASRLSLKKGPEGPGISDPLIQVALLPAKLAEFCRKRLQPQIPSYRACVLSQCAVDALLSAQAGSSLVLDGMKPAADQMPATAAVAATPAHHKEAEQEQQQEKAQPQHQEEEGQLRQSGKKRKEIDSASGALIASACAAAVCSPKA
jgi:hypothetical protein